MNCRLTASAIAIGLTLAVPFATANAQSAADMLTGHSPLPMKAPAVSKGGPATAQPAALPGAQSNASRVTPSSGKPSAEMSPNDALFDAINRGDIADARDAINRGAELDAPNILGLTPIDLAVDLGRNDITLLLLSMRGTTSTARTGKPSAHVAAADAKSARPAAAPAVHPTPRLAAAKPTPADPPVRRQLVSTDPGTPAPQVGFLGFAGAQHP
jgi:hypothetical protein